MTRAAPLPAYALFAAMLASAGLPIYIHAPKVYADDFGVSLTALGAVLFGLRLFDLVQDPGLGWVVARLGRWRGMACGRGRGGAGGGDAGPLCGGPAGRAAVVVRADAGAACFPPSVS